MVGLVAGLSAILLKFSLAFVEEELVPRIPIYLSAFFPLIGILLTVFFMRFVIREQLGHGVSGVLYDINNKSSFIKPSRMYSRIIASALTVGFGGSAGLESPIVSTGSAIGSNIARILHLDERKRTLFIACGAAAGISAIFNSPIAGMLFALEVILPELTVSSFIPVLFSAATATFLTKSLISQASIFSFMGIEPFSFSDAGFFVLFGLLCGLVSLYFSTIFMNIESLVKKFPNIYLRAIGGSLILVCLLLFFPPLYGEGYLALKNLLSGDAHLLMDNSGFSSIAFLDGNLKIYLFMVVLVKVFATAFTTGSGGCGGTFAPSMFTGGLWGYTFASGWNALGWFHQLSEVNFTLIGMAGVLAGVMHAPLTGIFLIAEITDGYGLIVPLMLVAALSVATKSYFQPHSLNTIDLIKRGKMVESEDKDQMLLNKINVADSIENDFKILNPEDTLGTLVSHIPETKRNIFPVLDSAGGLLGILLLDDIRKNMFKAEFYDLPVKRFMHDPPDIIPLGELASKTMERFEKSGAWNLPVIDREGKYLGFVSKSSLFSLYRQNLKLYTKDPTL